MAIMRLYPTKDSWITDYQKNNTPQTGSNFGASQVLRLFRVAPVNSTDVSGSRARILTKFDLSPVYALTSSLFDGNWGFPIPLPTFSNNNLLSFYLRFKNAVHPDTLPQSYDVEIERMAQDWDEGTGVDVTSFTDKGVTNWEKAKSNVFWNQRGGDLTGSIRANFHFDQGDEDLLVNVTEHVDSWLNDLVPNNGFMVHISSTLETGSQDYYYKSFHSRQTHFLDYRPYLEVRWDDSIKDDRNNFFYGLSGTLFLYNIVQGQYTNLPGIGTGNNVLTVKINDLSGTIKTVSASFTGITGLYSASFLLNSASFSGSTFTDVWFSGSQVYLSGNFTPQSNTAVVTPEDNDFVINPYNLRNSYESDEKVRIKLFVRNVDYFPSLLTTASNDPDGLVINRGYYRVINDRTNEVVIPFGTGSPETTRMSYDKQGNYFDIYMNALSPGNVYRLSFLICSSGERQIFEGPFKFRVE